MVVCGRVWSCVVVCGRVVVCLSDCLLKVVEYLFYSISSSLSLVIVQVQANQISSSTMYTLFTLLLTCSSAATLRTHRYAEEYSSNDIRAVARVFHNNNYSTSDGQNIEVRSNFDRKEHVGDDFVYEKMFSHTKSTQISFDF